MPSNSNSSAPGGDLPRWQLEDKFGFESPFSTAIDDYVEETKRLAIKFKETYEGKLEHFTDENNEDNNSNKKSLLYSAIQDYEEIAQRQGLVSSYIHLSYDTQLNNDALKKRKGALSQQRSALVGDYLEWFTLDVAALSKEVLEAHYKASPQLKTYQAFLDEIQRGKPHDLTKEVERALTVRAPYTGSRSVVGFLDKELSLLQFQLDNDNNDDNSSNNNEGKMVNLEVLLSRLGSSKDAAVRAKCLKALNDGLQDRVVRVAALSLSSVAGSWFIENEERKYATLRSRRNLDNNCPDAVVQSLLEGVRSKGVTLSKRYYGLKKEILKDTQGLARFTWSDRNAPIELNTGSGRAPGGDDDDDDEKISWTRAVEMVERGYRKFSPTMADMFLDMVQEGRIDVPAVDHKKGGAYCSGAIPGVGPFQLLNFDGTKRDVATLAHESGHGCHDILAYKQGYLQYHPPLTLAETASIFGEMIVFRDLLDLAKTPQERLTLLMSKIDDVINSVVRQCSFDRFEELAHAARKDGELSSDELDGFWKQAMEEYYGKAQEDGGDSPFDSYQDTAHLWSYVPHFHHVPFYVYSYAFADLVVGTLYHSFQTTPEGFEGRLLDLLGAGGTRDFATALQPFGLDPTSPSFWEDALEAHLGGLLAEAESIAEGLGYISTKASSS